MAPATSGKIDMMGTNTAPPVFAKFLKKEILGEMGHLLFALLNAFSASGYHIRLADTLPKATLDKSTKARQPAAASSRRGAWRYRQARRYRLNELPR